MQCPVCHGSGMSPGTFGTSFAIECGACHGSGWRPDPDPPSFDDDLLLDDTESDAGADEAGDDTAGGDTVDDDAATSAPGWPIIRPSGGPFDSLLGPTTPGVRSFLARHGMFPFEGPDATEDPTPTPPAPGPAPDSAPDSAPDRPPEPPSEPAASPPIWSTGLTSGLFNASSSYGDIVSSLFGAADNAGGNDDGDGDADASFDRPEEDWNELSDVQVLMKLLDVDRRYAAQLPFTMVGRATPATATALSGIVADYRRLAAIPRVLPTVSATDLQRKVAEARHALARVHESLDDLDAAETEYAGARAIYAAIGATRDVEGCDRSLRELRRHRDGDVDSTLDDLRDRLAATHDPLDRAALTVELAELHASVNDDFEAQDLFEQAEALLGPFRREATGGATADALTSTLSAIMSGQQTPGETGVERSMRIRGLLRRVYQGLGQILREQDPDRAAGYLDRLDDLEGSLDEGSRDNAEFTERMTDALDGLLGEMRRMLGEDD